MFFGTMDYIFGGDRGHCLDTERNIMWHETKVCADASSVTVIWTLAVVNTILWAASELRPAAGSESSAFVLFHIIAFSVVETVNGISLSCAGSVTLNGEYAPLLSESMDW